MAKKSLDRQLKLMTLVMEYAESCSHWCYGDSGPYCDSNIKTGNETYASHFIFICFNLERL